MMEKNKKKEILEKKLRQKKVEEQRERFKNLSPIEYVNKRKEELIENALKCEELPRELEDVLMNISKNSRLFSYEVFKDLTNLRPNDEGKKLLLKVFRRYRARKKKEKDLIQNRNAVLEVNDC